MRYFHTLGGKARAIYAGMRQRVEGRHVRNPVLWAGLPILPQDEFLRWALTHPEFTALHAAWAASDYKIKLAPSVDRIRSWEGYTLDNMQWLTHSENSRRGALSKHHGASYVAS
jgi:hypothetical protein